MESLVHTSVEKTGLTQVHSPMGSKVFVQCLLPVSVSLPNLVRISYPFIRSCLFLWYAFAGESPQKLLTASQLVLNWSVSQLQRLPTLGKPCRVS